MTSSQKPYSADQLDAWSILHGGSSIHSISEDVYYLMMDMHGEVDPERATMAIVDEKAAEVAEELLDARDNSDRDLQELKSQHMEWLINHLG